MRSAKSWGECDRTKGYKLRLIHLGKLNKSVHLDPSQPLSIYRDKYASFLWVSGGHLSQDDLTTCLRGERGSQTVLSAPVISQVPSF